MSFDGKTALVTGGANGIGKATALAFARKGCHVCILDIDVICGNQAAGEINSDPQVVEQGGKANFIEADVANEQSVHNAFEQALTLLRHLDFAHNNAGIMGSVHPTAEYPTELFDRLIATNLRGVYLCLKEELRHMVEQKHGAIVNTSSIVGTGGAPGLCAYSAAKHGIIGLTQSAAMEYIKYGIRINAICPGATDTPMAQQAPASVQRLLVMATPIGRAAKPDEIAEAVVWLCSDSASYMVGATLSVDGGYTAR